ncbi:serine/threonine-protein kinase 16-like [Gigantopelta aegis]|uniref:serine/threonine-protein kinase 16-like n=1 Tax=Gigantopelta aegis TaxID=1735272 RepID=UPI001B88CE61|nr:serine/threonine-protein kinase 16-like [Gigantopelta aegis]XP_041367216.1 serine/threonine-protein kinase 16-like [Gigantopelta aegis]
MNSLDLSFVFRMGCMCGKESLDINGRRFYVRSRLGEGGFSYVDLVEDAHSKQLFALKRITCHTKDEERQAMQEVEIMRTFRHMNIIPLEEYNMVPVNYHSQTVDIVSDVLIVMPYYRKGSIQDRMEILAKRSEKMSEDKIWRLFHGICNGVNVMHNHNPPYAHRDLKPANVMIAEDETPIIMDFGSAAKARVEVRNAKEATHLQDIAAERCTIMYRAPELFNVDMNADIDERTDVWSLGCVLYAMAFLESPFEQLYQRGDSLALAALGGNVKFPEHTGFSKTLEEMIMWMMTANAAERPFVHQVLDRIEVLQHQSENRV